VTDVDAVGLQDIRPADAGKFQELRRLDGAGGGDDRARRLRLARLAADVVGDADGAPAVE
jgi:hypothetical protein